ncbi:hypothetical protein HMPREF0027_0494 [Actinobacillus ureae ATCC 25976]|uniref:Uncharacterized protein n=1 Tax=Actinobacillus ureae ATCC 25976 TaxID=887324 RepID=E8KF77_9PAST|nr:hypothetical protein HMPREF0027_0494 [Actinobacillus ureae ATCC 25976]
MPWTVDLGFNSVFTSGQIFMYFAKCVLICFSIVSLKLIVI